MNCIVQYLTLSLLIGSEAQIILPNAFSLKLFSDAVMEPFSKVENYTVTHNLDISMLVMFCKLFSHNKNVNTESLSWKLFRHLTFISIKF